VGRLAQRSAFGHMMKSIQDTPSAANRHEAV